jgi:cellulose synthase/poly-beta-1,6-N-acetylglucosamine synthase-like glycosyltransferase
MVLQLITIIFLIAYALLISYYYKWWRRLDDFEDNGNEATSFISVIVPARNEASAIAQLLSSLQNQSYPKNCFEIIVVDDFSTDETAAIVKGFDLQNLKLIEPNVDSNISSKKKAIEAGIQQAIGELIVTTDADCIAPPNWLQTINSFHQQKKTSFIAAPVKFTHNNSFLQVFQSLDFMTLQGITAASVAANFHTMCNGANLAYTKKAFEEADGFQGIDRVATGDDMLLMYKIWKRNPARVFYLKSKEAIVTTPPMQTWKAFINQRKRWASKTLVYDDYRIIAVLGFIYLFNVLFFVLIGAAIVETEHWLGVLVFWIVKTIIELPFVYSVAKFYNEQRLLKYFFFFQPIHMFYTVCIGFISQLGKYEWKGRKTK